VIALKTSRYFIDSTSIYL